VKEEKRLTTDFTDYTDWEIELAFGRVTVCPGRSVTWPEAAVKRLFGHGFLEERIF
jgi:hypothetical protein